MIVRKMDQSDNVFANIGPEAQALKDAIKEIEKYFNDKDNDFNPAKEDNGVYSKKCKEGDCCLLEFFYHITNGGGYRNGIWIRANKNNDNWIFVLENINGLKKAILCSLNNLNCNGFVQTNINRRGNINQQGIPFDFETTPTYREAIDVADITYAQLMQEIESRFCCICK